MTLCTRLNGTPSVWLADRRTERSFAPNQMEMHQIKLNGPMSWMSLVWIMSSFFKLNELIHFWRCWPPINLAQTCTYCHNIWHTAFKASRSLLQITENSYVTLSCPEMFSNDCTNMPQNLDDCTYFSLNVM
jgi:hypothetical protein